jgi:acyl-homoserine-lactone acylase
MRSILALVFFLFWGLNPFFAQKINPANIQIARDKWGVPHVFSKTNPELAYGLAWANAEDMFDVMQDVLILCKAKMGRLNGIEGAKYDFFVQAIGAKKMIDANYEKEITPEYKAYLEGYAQGINAYAAAHPKKVRLKGIFPVTPKDVLVGYIASFALLTGVPGAVEDIVNGKVDKYPSLFDYKKEKAQSSLPPIEQTDDNNAFGRGSNAFALNSKRTTDGSTFVGINPHFMVDGPLSFYEAHICSEEGLNIAGAFFQGCNAMTMGANQHLAWGLTYNYLDHNDIFELKMHPTKKLYYEYDGKWLKLEKNPIKLRVKIGKIVIPVRKMTYHSVHGLSLKSKKKKFYAVSAGALQNILASQQFYYMNKATNVQEFKKALEMQGVPLFNIIYGDQKDNIYYLSAGWLPKRNEKYNAEEILPGNTSDTKWQTHYTIEELPNVLNPASGYVFTTNNPPQLTTAPADAFPAEKVTSAMNQRPFNNNRAERFNEWISSKEKFNFEDFKKMKFDTQLPKNSRFLSSVDLLFKIDENKYPELKEIIRTLKNWDRKIDLNSIGATHFTLCMEYLLDHTKHGSDDTAFFTGITIDEPLVIQAMNYATDFLKKYYGHLNVPYGKTQFFQHPFTKEETPVLGFPDVLAANYPRPYKDGKFKLQYGDTYISFVKFERNGKVKIESLTPFATYQSGQYENQLKMYNARQTKEISLDKETVLKTAVKVYAPK